MSISSIFSPRCERKAFQVYDSLIERAFKIRRPPNLGLCTCVEAPEKIQKKLQTKRVCFLGWSDHFSSEQERAETIKSTYDAFFQSIENIETQNKIALPFYFISQKIENEDLLDQICHNLAKKIVKYLKQHSHACFYIHFNQCNDWTNQAAHFIYACREATAWLPSHIGKRIRVTIKPLSTYKPHTCALYIQKNFLCPEKTLSEYFLEETRKITYDKEYTERGNSPYLKRRVPRFLNGENPSETQDADL